ncbi:sugar transmembrane transporter activity protein [Dispira parvispora]|uniref:Sugar transporter SWEET1 n=1 Tax=Dispira parvispora TaxID=1520584 RepID=A0A9W8ALU2_9FUNG|nr:sugar transmembrane transporter activity protein [Dispira parvispora]
MSHFVEWVATGFTVAMFVSGLSVVKQLKTGGAGIKQLSPLPAFATLVNTVLWCKYGLRNQDVPMVLVNTFGALTSSALAYAHYHYTPHTTRVEKLGLYTALLLVAVLGYVNYLAPVDKATMILGWCCCLGAVVMFGSPLAAMNTVVTSRSTFALSFPLSLTSFGTSASWAWYGYDISDSFVFAPNFAGAILAAVQLAMFVIYRNRNDPYTSVSIAP